MEKPIHKSKAWMAGLLLVVVTLAVFAGAWLYEGKSLEEAATTTAKVMGVLGTALAGLGIIGLRDALGRVLSGGTSTGAHRGPTGRLGVLLAFLTVLMAGCVAGPPTDVLPGGAGASMQPATGEASAESTGLKMPIGPATSWGASTAESHATSADYSPQHSNAGSGHILTGIQIAATAKLVEMAQDQLKNDAVLVSLHKEMEELQALETVLTAEQLMRLDHLRESYAARAAEIGKSMQGLSGDFSSLQNLFVFNLNRANVGHDERAISDAEAHALSVMLSNAIAASRGEEVVSPFAPE